MIGYSDTDESPIRPIKEAYNMDEDLKDITRDAFDDLVLGDSEHEEWVYEPAEEADGATNNPGRNTTAPNVKTPAKAEVEEHEKTHLPFRSWCKACVKGRGVASPHARRDGVNTGVPHIDIDYCFPRAKVTILG